MTTAIRIEKGIPLPRPRSVFNFAFNEMEAGDSFRVDDERSRQAALRAGKRHGHNVTSAKIDGGGFRVWKLAGKLPSRTVSPVGKLKGLMR